MERMLPVGEAAQALGVSLDTLRRWEREGRVRTERDSRNRRLVPETEVTRIGGHVAEPVDTAFSARNRFPGVVTAVEVSGVVAQVEIQAGPHHVVAIVTRDAVREMGLAPGVEAVATVKATSVMVRRA